MKTSALFALLMFAFSAMSATYHTTPETLDCRKATGRLAPHLTAAQLVEQDLVDGGWSQQTNTGAWRKYQFNHHGEAQVLEMDAEGNLQVAGLQWWVDEREGKAVLTLRQAGGQAEHQLEVQQTCEGLVLTDLADGSSSFLAYRPLLSAAQWEALKASLEGEWTNVSWSSGSNEGCGNMEQNEGAFFNFCFKTDGTYKMACGNSQQKVETKGNWELSKDGQFIFFHQEKGLPKVAKIARMDEHGLVLEHSMNAPGFGDFFCENLRSFTFIK
jgi:hypothetical protein